MRPIIGKTLIHYNRIGIYIDAKWNDGKKFLDCEVCGIDGDRIIGVNGDRIIHIYHSSLNCLRPTMVVGLYNESITSVVPNLLNQMMNMV